MPSEILVCLQQMNLTSMQEMTRILANFARTVKAALPCLQHVLRGKLIQKGKQETQ